MKKSIRTNRVSARRMRARQRRPRGKSGRTHLQRERPQRDIDTAAKTESQEWMKREEARVWLNISIRTLDNWMLDGTLPFYKRGAVVRLNRDECAAALKKFRHQSRWDTSAGEEEEGL